MNKTLKYTFAILALIFGIFFISYSIFVWHEVAEFIR